MNLRDDAPPWSFFIPVTLAVIVGVLSADGIRYAFNTVFDSGETPVPAEADSRRPSAVDPSPAAPETKESAADVRSGQPRDDAPARVAAPEMGSTAESSSSTPAEAIPGAEGSGVESAAEGVRELPDSMTARRDGDPEACVNGTVVRRVAGGWEQALENDVPIPCVIVHR